MCLSLFQGSYSKPIADTGDHLACSFAIPFFATHFIFNSWPFRSLQIMAPWPSLSILRANQHPKRNECRDDVVRTSNNRGAQLCTLCNHQIPRIHCDIIFTSAAGMQGQDNRALLTIRIASAVACVDELIVDVCRIQRYHPQSVAKKLIGDDRSVGFDLHGIDG